MDILTPTLEQNPVFGNTASEGSSLFLKWEYEVFKFMEWTGDILPVIFSHEVWNIIKSVLSLISMFFIAVMIYCAVRMFEIRKKEHEHLHHEIAEYAHKMAEKEKEEMRAKKISGNQEWVSVMNHFLSPDSSDWKMSILEADNMLLELLTQLGFKGEGVGEKLKSADLKMFKKLPIAWEAHTVRNKIAHEGPSFVLSKKEAGRIITLYEQIFQEYGFI